MMRANYIIAASFGWDSRDVSEYRYQRYTSPSVYAIGDRYFAVSKTKPKHKDVGGEWMKHTDQFWAEKNGTTIWVCGALRADSGV